MKTTMLRSLFAVAAFTAASVCAQAYYTQQNAYSAIGNFDFWYQNFLGDATDDINNSGASQGAKDDALVVLNDIGLEASDPGNFGWGAPVPFSYGGAEGWISCVYDWEMNQWSLSFEIYW